MQNIPHRPLPTKSNPNDVSVKMAIFFQEESRLRDKSTFRLLLLSAFFSVGFLLIIIKLTLIAGTNISHLSNMSKNTRAVETRKDIVDRNGNILATNIPVNSLYAHPKKLLDAEFAATNLELIFPKLKKNDLLELFKKNPKFVFLRKSISAQERIKVLELGEPGLQFGERELRIYPNGNILSHVLGKTKIKQISTVDAVLEGISGVEKMFDNELRGQSFEEKPLELSIDLATQSVLENILSDGMNFFNAKGGSGIIMDVTNGEIIGMVSLPNFNPNSGEILGEADITENILLNKAVQGTYELGSVLKIFTAALAIEVGGFSPHTLIDVSYPVQIGNTKPIKDKRWLGEKISLKEVIAKSSNVGSARVISTFDPIEQKKFLESFGFFNPTGIELPEANVRSSVGSDPWTNYKAAMIAIGHGIRVSPLHLASAYATAINGGFKVPPTILRNSERSQRKIQIISRDTSVKLREILGEVVNSGTAQNAKIEGYSIGGKTGTAEKFDSKLGKFNFEKNYASFASFFPLHNPRFLVLICLDEASNAYKKINHRVSGNTAVPLSAEIIRRVAPLLGLRPVEEGFHDENKNDTNLISDKSAIIYN